MLEDWRRCWLPLSPMCWLGMLVVILALAFFLVGPASGYTPGLGCATWAARLREAEEGIVQAQLDDVEVPTWLRDQRTRARAVLDRRCRPPEDDREPGR